METEEVTFGLLEEITDSFSEKRKLGEGAFGAVYKGLTKNGDVVAVKKLHNYANLDDEQFQNEFKNLENLPHQNIVRILGYCYETKQVPMELNGREVLVENIYRALCFEYLPNGSLENYLHDEFRGFDWHARYNIIKGVCEGLHYLHRRSDKPIYHLDLKPENILLDNDLVPKIADFGLSKIFTEKTRTTPNHRIGTPGYQPPEHIDKGEISDKFDIFSLGVMMIKIISGKNSYSDCADMNNDEFIDRVIKNWKDRLQATWSGSLLGVYCNQVKACTEIALNCVEDASQKRPDTTEIIDKLNEVEAVIGKVKSSLGYAPFPPTSAHCGSRSIVSATSDLAVKLDFSPGLDFQKKVLQTFASTVHHPSWYPVEPFFLLATFHSVTFRLSEESVALALQSCLGGSATGFHVQFHSERQFRFSVCSKKVGFHIYALQSITTSSFEVHFHLWNNDMNHLELVKLKQEQLLPNEISSETSGTTMHNELPDQTQNFKQNTSARSIQLEGIPDTSIDIGEKHIVGRIDEKEKIMGSLLECMPQTIAILPIYGVGGIGKTTLAKMIYNEFKDIPRGWVYVSQTFDLNKISDSIDSQLKNVSQTFDLDKIHDSIDSQLKNSKANEDLDVNKKMLIVLDDLWEDDALQLSNLKRLLSEVGTKHTLCVLVTTRREEIANKICMNLKPHKMNSLSDEMCWDIIKQRSCFETRHDKEHLTEIGMQIAKKCGGVALAAQSLGYMLQSMTSDQWMKVRSNDIWNKSIAEDTSSPNHVLQSLKLSYDSMTQSLKSCFSYCAILRKGDEISSYDLIYQWISLGFVKPTKLLSVKQLCEKYIMHLEGLSFLENSETDMVAYGKKFTMHDLVHELARSVTVGILDATKECNTGRPDCCYALLPDCSKPLELLTASPAKITAIRILPSYRYHHTNTICYAALSCAKSLRVLDFCKCLIELLPDSISQLKQLRYLNAPSIQALEIMHGITNLSELVYLNLSGSNFKALPESIGELEYLMHLDVSGCYHIKELPESFVNLKRLVHLDLSECEALENVPKHLVGLTNIQYLNLSGMARSGNSPIDVAEVIGNLTELQYLSLERMVPAYEAGFNLIGCICTLWKLEHLDLSHNRGIVKLPESLGNLKKLHTLLLDFCVNLVKLPECLDKMDSLKVLGLGECFHLPKFVVQADDDDDDASISNIGSLRHVHNEEELQIRQLDKVKSIKEVRGIELVKKQRMRTLKLEWTRDVLRSLEDMEVLAELVPPDTLDYFIIIGYSSVGFPAWVLGIASYLPNLCEIRLEELPKCNVLPPLGQLPNLKKLAITAIDGITTIEKGFYGGAGAFSRLVAFQLCSMKNLEVWNIMHSYGQDGVKESMFPNLHCLAISDCPKLRLIQCPPKARTGEINSSDNVLSSCGSAQETCASFSKLQCTAIKCLPESMQHLTSLKYLSLSACPSITTLPECLDHLASLKVLSISRCTGIKCLPERMQPLTSLQRLHLNDCPGITTLPECLGDLTSLKDLSIVRCTNVKCLPGSMKYLTSLQYLDLTDCPSITTLPECLGNLTSLKVLLISGCTGIKCLPGSMKHLTSLQYLDLTDCPSITTLPECLGGLASIEKLLIRGCTGIKCLPERI